MAFLRPIKVVENYKENAHMTSDPSLDRMRIISFYDARRK